MQLEGKKTRTKVIIYIYYMPGSTARDYIHYINDYIHLILRTVIKIDFLNLDFMFLFVLLF